MVTASAVIRDDVLAALETVNDPHIPVSLNRMGMLESVTVGPSGDVRVDVCVPCMGCPGGSLIESEITDRLREVDGVTSVHVELGWFLRWDRDDVDEEARALMRSRGIQI